METVGKLSLHLMRPLSEGEGAGVNLDWTGGLVQRISSYSEHQPSCAHDGLGTHGCHGTVTVPEDRFLW